MMKSVGLALAALSSLPDGFGRAALSDRHGSAPRFDVTRHRDVVGHTPTHEIPGRQPGAPDRRAAISAHGSRNERRRVRKMFARARNGG